MPFITALTFFIFILSFVTWYLGGLFRKTLIDKLTAVNDLVHLGASRPNHRRLTGTAVIAGASIAGLLAARVCSDHFESVLLVEPEASLDDYNQGHFNKKANSDYKLTKRTRIPQYTAPHGYQVLTLRALKKLFPYFEDRLLSWGGRILPADMRVHISGWPISPLSRSILLEKTLFISRHLFESFLRSLVSVSHPKVQFMEGSIVGIIPGDGAAADKDNIPLKAVIIRQDGKDTVHDVALFVDCTGPIQAGLKWLDKAGYSLHPSGPMTLRTSYDPKFKGTSCHFRVPAEALQDIIIPHPRNKTLKGSFDTNGCIYLYIPDPRRDTRNFLIERVEGDWLQMVCSGYDIPDRPLSVADVKAFVASVNPKVPIPQYIFDLLNLLDENRQVETLGWHYIRVPPVSFVRYDKAHSLPGNFVALGDAVCQLNPIHGQGVTMAIICAVTLNAALTSTGSGSLPLDFASQFFKKQAARLEGTWEANKSDDYGFATTIPAAGENHRYGWFRRWYGSHLVEIASRDNDVATKLWYIENFLAPATDVFFPSVLGKVIWNWIKSGGQ